MDELINSVESTTSLPLVKNGKCQGCHETTKDGDVLCCYLCKQYYHVINCTVTEALRVSNTSVLPSNTNLTNFSKFSSLSYPTGKFIWTCFRCGSLQELASKDNINQRLAVLESILVTMHPTLSSIAKLMNNDSCHDISKLVSGIRATTTENATSTENGTTNENIDVTPIDAPSLSPAQPESSPSDNILDKDLPHQNAVLLSDSPPAVAPVFEAGLAHDTMHARKTHQSAPRSIGTKFRISVKSKNEDGPPLRRIFQRAHSSGKIDIYSTRYFSNHKADLLFDSFEDANAAHISISSELTDVEANAPSCMNTKLVHVVGLTEDDSKESVYNAICKPGRNSAIEHLVNPGTLRVLNVQPCKNNKHVYRATVVMSEAIWDTVLNKMNEKLKVDYLSCTVFLRPDSIRCYKCQRLGHTMKTCKGDITCAVCGGNHASDGCKNPPKCINCFESGIDSNHRADATDCTAFKNFRKGHSKK